MTALREIIAIFGVEFDDKELRAGNKAIDAAISGLKDFGKVLVGGAVVVGIKNMVMELVGEASALVDQAAALGVSTQALEEWQFAAQLSGSSAEEFGAAFTKFTKNVNEAAENAKGPAAEAFKALGVEIKDSTGQLGEPIDLLDGVVAGLESIEDPAKRTAVVMDLFGKSGARLLPLFSEGPEGIAKLREEVKALGGGFGGANIAAFEEFGDNMDRIDFAMKSVKIGIVNLVIPALTRLALGTAKLIGRFKGWLDGWIKIAKQSNIFRLMLLWLGTLGVAHVFKLVGGFGGLWKMLLRGIGILTRFLLKFLLPALILDELITMFQGGDTLIGRAIDGIFGAGTTAQIVGWCTSIFNTIVEFITRLIEAFRTGGMAGVLGVLMQVVDAIAGLIAEELIPRIIAAWEYLGTWFEAFTLELVSPFQMAAASIQDAFGEAWNNILAGAQELLGKVQGILSFIPGAGDLLGRASAALEGMKAEGGNASATQEGIDTHRLDIASRQGQLASKVTGPMNNSSSTVTNVTVPPGTPADMAKKVGAAATAGAQKGTRANLAGVRRVAPG